MAVWLFTRMSLVIFMFVRLCILTAAVFQFAVVVVGAFAGLRAAQNLYRKLLTNVLYAGVAFFDQNPVGRILNRFSSDMYA